MTSALQKAIKISTHNRASDSENTVEKGYQNFPPVRELTIEGVKKQDVIETRLACLKAAEATQRKPAGTCKMATNSKSNAGHLRHASRRKQTPVSTFRLIETSDASLGTMMAAKAVGAGLAAGETVVLLSFQKPEHTLRKLEMTGLDATAAIKNNKLVILDSEALLDDGSSETIRYKKLFASMQNELTTPLDRIVILEMDKLLDLQSQHAAYLSVSKFTQAADEMGIKIIAQYVREHNEAYDRLDAACSSAIPSYFVMHRDKETGKYRLSSKNHPV